MVAIAILHGILISSIPWTGGRIARGAMAGADCIDLVLVLVVLDIVRCAVDAKR
jgi:hypothetical protein